MILKIDHIGISSVTVDKSIEELEKLGYSLMFYEKRVAISREKKSVLLNDVSFHDYALLTSEIGIGIEFLDHGLTNEVDSPMSLVLTGVSSEDYNIVKEVMICGKPYKEVFLSTISCNAIILKDDGPHSCKGICLNTENLDQSIKFWKWFGCKVTEADKRSAHLTFKEVLSRKTWSIYLVFNPDRSSMQYMDSPGVNSVAFVSSSAVKDKDTLTTLGYKTTPIYNLRVNGRLLSILFIRGPSGEIIEILNPVKEVTR